jgi:hypothetical protein
MAEIIFHHIANANPGYASSLCSNYGFDCDNAEDGAEALQQISMGSNEGYKDVLSLLPEKDVIVEMFGSENKSSMHNANGNCPRCEADKMIENFKAANGGGINSFYSANGSGQQMQNMLMQTNTFIVLGIVASILVAVHLKN